MFHPQGPTLFELAKQALSSTRRGYDLLAPKFDLTPYRTPEVLIEKLLPFFDPGAESAIDVCCGTGAGLEVLTSQTELRELVGIDFSPGMLAEAREKFENCDRIKLVEGDVLEMGFCGEFDIAICLGALGHFVGDNYAELLERIFTSLKPGGQYLFPAAAKPGPGSGLYWFCQAFNAALGLRNLVLRPQFIMYYHKLMFDGPDLRALLEETGFEVQVHEVESSGISDGLVQPGFRVVVARKPKDAP